MDREAWSALCSGNAPTAAKARAGRSSTFSVVPLKTVPSSKRRTSLDVTINVAGDGGQQAGDERGTQNSGFFAERVAEWERSGPG